MRNSIKNRDKGKLDNYIITFGLRGLVAHDQRKTSNPTQNWHKHTNKAEAMITICSHGVVHASQLSKVLKVISNS